jgi:hypothetical protein
VVKAADAFSALAAIRSAAALIARLRADGLDQHFTEVARASARPDRDDLTVLADAEREAAGKTVPEYAARLAARRLSLRKARDDRDGIELTTVHRAKGRQWPRVVVVACDEDVLPHRNALQEAGEGVEAERRVAYVAFTRATEELSILSTEERPSRFLHEAGLLEPPPTPEPPPRAGPWQREELDRAALEFAATALKQDLPETEDLTVRHFLASIARLGEAELRRVHRAVPGLDPEQHVERLSPSARRALAATLRVLARRS